ncbi:hypothetical protein BDN72DRAFT_906655 [Pluteus cervinus]|uniref:Uncharacterized protein n=1 Tax=Pluteus cervinus TaxID=181527 RepID=A0ACD2ZYT6_9AGAR|nr:hypothetical protein BDN72DRAFT_906655 [Pluteus cervinus]
MGKETIPNSNIVERRRVMKRIRKLSRRIRQLKYRCNELAHINRLPPELLIRIFLFLQSDFYEVQAGDYYRWTVVSHISRSWRALALGAKQLWTGTSEDMSEVESPWVAASLERSRPLKVDVVLRIDSREPQSRPIYCNPTTRTLCVNVVGHSCENYWGSSDIAERIRALEAPALEEFELTGTDQFGEPEDSADSDHSPPALFNSCAPYLQSIKIVGFNISLGSIPFQGMTSLTLRYKHEHYGVLSFRALFDFLRMNPALRLLHLEYALLDADDVDDDVPIHLPSLSSMTLFFPTRACIRLLSCLVVPPSCWAIIWGCSTPSDIRDVSSHIFFDAILSRLSNDPTEFNGLEFELGNDFVSFDLRRKIHWENETWAPEASIQIRFISPADADGISLTLPSLSSYSDVWSIQLCASPGGCSASTIEALMSSLSLLPSLLEMQPLDSPFLLALSDHLYANPLSFTKLNKIDVFTEDGVTPPLDSIDRLARALSIRKESKGNPIGLILNDSCGWAERGPYRDVLDRLRMVASELHIF